MVFDSIILAAIADELNKTLLNGKITDIYQPTPLDVRLTIRNAGMNHNLLISADAENPRIHLTSIKSPNPPTPPDFCMLLRKYLKSARFKGADQQDLERILSLRFSTYDDQHFTLIVEIMGKYSNIILINDATRKILGVIKPISRSKNRYREILVGREYILPPVQNKANPFTTSAAEIHDMLIESFPDQSKIESDMLESWIVRTFAGISPFAAREIVCRAEGQLQRIPETFEHLIEDIKKRDFSPVIISDDTGKTIGFYPFHSAQYPESNQFERPYINSAADIFYASYIPKATVTSRKYALLKTVKREIESRERTIAFIQDSLNECRNADRYKQLGDMILAQSSNIDPGSNHALLIDYYSQEGAYIEVELNPKLTPAQNAELYFKKYQKAASSVESLRHRLESTQMEIEELRNIMTQLQETDSEDDVDEAEKQLTDMGLQIVKQEVGGKERKRPEFGGFRVAKHTIEGFEILVGMNSQANDYLITHVAKPNDIWVHTKAVPSAHVVIRTNGRPDSVPRQVIEYAADLAARTSDAKHSSLVPVDYTLRKYLRKPKGAPSGKVLYTHEKTIYITPA